jgi:molybdenum cofactor cytidylyltransferase
VKYAAIILAAGGGSRFQQTTHKLLVEIQGKPLIHFPIAAAIAAQLDPIIVVVGALAQEIEKVLADQPVKVVMNEDWSLGQSTSLRAGIAALPPDVDAVCIFLADQPFIALQTIESLKQKQIEYPDRIIVPAWQGKRGNPTFFPRTTFADLLNQAPTDQGGRALIKKYGAIEVEVTDPYVVRDIDTFEDYQNYLKQSPEEGYNSEDGH